MNRILKACFTFLSVVQGFHFFLFYLELSSCYCLRKLKCEAKKRALSSPVFGLSKWGHLKLSRGKQCLECATGYTLEKSTLMIKLQLENLNKNSNNRYTL